MLQSIYLFSCFLLSLCSGGQLTPTKNLRKPQRKMCCNSKSTSESGVGFSPTDEAVCLLVENASLGPNAHTARTESNFSLVTKTEERCSKSTYYRKENSIDGALAGDSSNRRDCDIARDWSPNEMRCRERKMRESTQLPALLPFQSFTLL